MSEAQRLCLDTDSRTGDGDVDLRVSKVSKGEVAGIIDYETDRASAERNWSPS